MSRIINSPDSNGSLPLSLAITSKNLEMVEILMREGAKVSHESIITAARSVLYTISKYEFNLAKVICAIMQSPRMENVT